VDPIAVEDRMSVALLAAGTAAGSVLAVCVALQDSARSSPRATGRNQRTLGSRRRARARAARLGSQTPQLLDLLAAGSIAGLSPELSVRRAAEILQGPLGQGLRRVTRAADLGTPWREALGSFARDAGDPDLQRAVSVLARSEMLGVPLAETTRDLAIAVRDSRRATALERARTAPVKMLFPLVFLILPAFLLLTVVPVLITTVRSIG
jgi:tight adherence protein C